MLMQDEEAAEAEQLEDNDDRNELEHMWVSHTQSPACCLTAARSAGLICVCAFLNLGWQVLQRSPCRADGGVRQGPVQACQGGGGDSQGVGRGRRGSASRGGASDALHL